MFRLNYSDFNNLYFSKGDFLKLSAGIVLCLPVMCLVHF